MLAGAGVDPLLAGLGVEVGQDVVVVVRDPIGTDPDTRSVHGVLEQGPVEMAHETIVFERDPCGGGGRAQRVAERFERDLGIHEGLEGGVIAQALVDASNHLVDIAWEEFSHERHVATLVSGGVSELRGDLAGDALRHGRALD